MTTAAPEVATPAAVRPPRTPAPRPTRRTTRLLLPVLLALLALPLLTAAHLARPAPYGDRLTVHTRVQPDSVRVVPDVASAPEPALRTEGRAVQAYDPATGRARWSHERAGRTPLALLSAPGHALTLWDDGLVTDTEPRRGSAVRWHRALPATADWLRTPAAHGGAGVLRVLDPHAHMLAVVTPRRITAYRTADGDLRWTLPAASGCAFEPRRAVHHGRALLVAQPCADPDTPWTDQLVAVDDLGRIAPGRRPLGNALPGERPVESTGKASEKLLAHPR